ncbi:hypothetical protein [Streptomyces sp. NPDC004296]|uniref:hypothetical protein n=1 Tax=Streptomyces sp. NPDC004296 TaxID=3364697 RepID=UPI0036B06159
MAPTSAYGPVTDAVAVTDAEFRPPLRPTAVRRSAALNSRRASACQADTRARAGLLTPGHTTQLAITGA